MSELFIAARTRPLAEVRTCGCGTSVVRIERVYGGFDLGEVHDVDVADGERHNPNCGGAR